jgi:hypothetical protein
MSAFLELTYRDSGRKMLINSAAIRKVHARQPDDTGCVLEWTAGTNEFSNGQIDVAETFDEVCSLIGAAEAVVHIEDGDVRYKSIP